MVIFDGQTNAHPPDVQRSPLRLTYSRGMHTLDSVQGDIHAFERQRGELMELNRLVRAEPAWQAGLEPGLESSEVRRQAEASFDDALEHSGRMNRHIEQFQQSLPLLIAAGDTPDRRQVLLTLATHLRALTEMLQLMNARLRTTLNGLRQQRGAAEYEFVPPDSN